MLERTIEQYTAGDYVEDWDLDALTSALAAIYPVTISQEIFQRAWQGVIDRHAALPLVR